MQAPLLFRKVRARIGRLWRHDDGSSSVEWVALTACIAALMVVVAMALQSQGARIGTSIGQVIQCHIVAVGNGASCGNGIPGSLSIGGAIPSSVGNVGTAAAGLPLMLAALPIPPGVALVLGLIGLLVIGGLAAGLVMASNLKIASDSVAQKVTGAHTTVAAVEPKRARAFAGGAAMDMLLAQVPDIRQDQTPTRTPTPTSPGQSSIGYAANVGNRMTGAIGVGAVELGDNYDNYLRVLALLLLAESSNGTVPMEVTRLKIWSMFNKLTYDRLERGITTSYYRNSWRFPLALAIQEYITIDPNQRPSSTAAVDEFNRLLGIANTYQNNPNYQAIYAEVQAIYEDWRQYGTNSPDDPTHGAVQFHDMATAGNSSSGSQINITSQSAVQAQLAIEQQNYQEDIQEAYNPDPQAFPAGVSNYVITNVYPYGDLRQARNYTYTVFEAVNWTTASGAMFPPPGTPGATPSPGIGTPSPQPPGATATPSAATVAPAVPAAMDVVTQQAQNINVREGPGLGEEVVSLVHPGDEVAILERGAEP